MGHTHDDTDAAADHGPVGIPAEPAERWITPAASDFASTPPLPRLVWPVFWIGLTVAIALPLIGLVRDRGFITVNLDGHAHADEEPDAPAHAD
jgi:hypothetical protein